MTIIKTSTKSYVIYLKDFRGKCPVIIEYQSSNASGNIPLSREYDVSLDRELLDTIEQKFGQDKYQINY